MADVAETRDSPVGAQHAVPAVGRGFTSQDGWLRAPPGPNNGGTGDSPVIPHNKSRASQPGLPGEDLIFDAAKLHSQLADLLQIYLKRASSPDAIEKCSAKDALACAKTLTAMMSDVQSGKPASVSRDTRWSYLESRAVGRDFTSQDGWLRAPPGPNNGGTGDPPVIAPKKSRANEPGLLKAGSSPGYRPPATRYSPLLEDALSIVLASDEESTIPEPYKRFIARIEKLCKETRQRLDAAESRAPDDLINEPITGGMGACPPQLQRRRVPPVIPPNPPARRRCHQGFPDNCANDTKSRASERGLPNMDGTSSSPADSRKLTADSCKPGLPSGDSQAPIPNPSPLASSPAPPRRKRRSLYTFGTTLWSNNQQLTTNNRVRAAPRTPT